MTRPNDAYIRLPSARLAALRVSIKRRLRRHGVTVDNTASTRELAQLVSTARATEAAEVARLAAVVHEIGLYIVGHTESSHEIALRLRARGVGIVSGAP